MVVTSVTRPWTATTHDASQHELQPLRYRLDGCCMVRCIHWHACLKCQLLHHSLELEGSAALALEKLLAVSDKQIMTC